MQKFDGSLLEHFSATDSQNEKWNLKFKIDPGKYGIFVLKHFDNILNIFLSVDSDPNNVFRMVSAGRSEGELQLINQPNYENIYKVGVCKSSKHTIN